MKSIKIFYLVIMLFALVSSASALSDKEYRQLIKNQSFSDADKALNQAWTNAKNSLSEKDFNALKKSQTRWIKSGRDNEARQLLKKLSRVQAYTLVTNSRADYINNYVSKRAINTPDPEIEPEDSQNDLPADLPAEIPEDVPDLPSESPSEPEISKINLADSFEAEEYLTEKLIDSGKIQPNEEIKYLDSEVEINGVQCWEFSSSFNFVETGRYAISQNGNIYIYQDEKYIMLK